MTLRLSNQLGGTCFPCLAGAAPKAYEFLWIVWFGLVLDRGAWNRQPGQGTPDEQMGNGHELLVLEECAGPQDRQVWVLRWFSPEIRVAACAGLADPLPARTEDGCSSDRLTLEKVQCDSLDPHRESERARRTPLAVRAVTGVESQRFRPKLEVNVSAEAVTGVWRWHGVRICAAQRRRSAGAEGGRMQRHVKHPQLRRQRPALSD